jgi:predicted nucleic-acid-binding Zn-ribbon protein
MSEDGDPTHVYCPDCGSKAAADWSFCRSCRASLEGAEPEHALVVREDGTDVDLSAFTGEPDGCVKCGHDEATADDIGTTGQGFSRGLDVQNRRFRAVSCTRCGYTELYRDRSARTAVALFLR